ncbi:hypothetical protein OROGR_024481 [Orobanche gracilis]
MPVLRSSSNGGAGKVSRKVKVALGYSKASGDVKNPSPKSSSNVDKARGRARVATGKSKGSRDGFGTVESKINGSKMMKSREIDNAAVSDVNLSEMRGREKKNFKTKNGHQAFEAVIDVKSDQKRKRTYADPGIVEDRMLSGLHKKSISKSKNHVLRLYLDKGKRKVSRGNNRELEDKKITSRGNASFSSQFKGSELLEKKIRWRKAEGADKLKQVQENGLGNRTLKTSDERKTPLAVKRDLNQRTHVVGLVAKPIKKNDHVKKSLVTDSDLTNAPLPKKKKRVIRIDPHDISNKRLDDGIAGNGKPDKRGRYFVPDNSKSFRSMLEKKSKKMRCNSEANMNSEEIVSVEMSKNAQFRAIRPSCSILSFVEDNLLGRRRDIDFRRAGYNTQLSAPLDNIPFITGSERERIEVPVFRNKLEFFAAAKMSSSFPSPDLPEIAFAGNIIGRKYYILIQEYGRNIYLRLKTLLGRSNVGKSSLLNALTRQWGVVRTSDKPGLTQTINFFKLGPKLSLVDLPGYGFAYAKEEVKEAWEELVKEYVTTRVGLKRVCILVDTKWGMKPRDLELIDLMESSQTKYQVVLTKTDLVFPIDVARRATQIEENLKAKKSAVQPLMMISSKTGAGIRSLRTVLANVARPANQSGYWYVAVSIASSCVDASQYGVDVHKREV